METNQALFNTSPNGMVVVGDDGTTTRLNPAAEKIFACTLKDLEGKKFTEFLKEIAINGDDPLEKCMATTPYTVRKKAKVPSGKTRILDLCFTLNPSAPDEDRYLVFVNDITAQKKRESDLKRAYATENTLKKILQICRTGEKVGDTLMHVLQLTVALPDIKALPRAVIMSTGATLSRLDLQAEIGLEPDEISDFFQEGSTGVFSLENTSEQTDSLCKFVAGDNRQYHAIIADDTKTVVMVVALKDEIKNTFATKNLNSIADIVADTIGRKKQKKELSGETTTENKTSTASETRQSFSDSVLESLTSGVLIIDADNKITRTNPAAERFLLHIYEGNVAGKTLREVFGPKAETLQLDGDTTNSQRISVVDLNGEEINLEFTASTIASNENDLTGKNAVVFSDVTELQKMQIRFDKLNRFGAIAEIAVAIAQELKNPLTGIKSMSQLLDNRLSADNENKEFIARIIKQVDRLDLLLNEFFLYARPVLPNKQKVMLNDILRKAWQMAEARGNKKGLSLHEDLSGDAGALNADPEQLQQVFVNLFLNAIEAISDNSYVKVTSEFVKKPSKKFDLSLFKGLDDDCSYLVVVISDSGCGISKNMAAKLFDPFVTDKNNHSGLGLSLVWRILKEHESNIYFDSTEGKGTTFTLFLKSSQGVN